MDHIKANWSNILELTEENIDENVKEDKIGNYRLAKKLNENKGLTVAYVGRTNKKRLAERIKDHIDEGYKYFRYCYKKSEKESYLQECSDFHEFGKEKSLDNARHPEVPQGEDFECPFCKEENEV